MIRLKTERWRDGSISQLTLQIDDETALIQFTELVNRALNCWDQAPKDLKELGDILTHGRVTQDHSPVSITRTSSKE